MTVMDGTVRIWDPLVKLEARVPQKILMSYTDLSIGLCQDDPCDNK